MHPRLSSPRYPERLNFHCLYHSGRVVAKAGPGPVLRLLDQPASYEIAMDIAQLLCTLGAGILVEVVVSSLPEWALLLAHADRQLQCLNRAVELAHLRFAHEHVHMLRHHHVTKHSKFVPPADSLHRVLVYVTDSSATEIWPALK